MTYKILLIGHLFALNLDEIKMMLNKWEVCKCLQLDIYTKLYKQKWDSL